jgi:hypothetical protein
MDEEYLIWNTPLLQVYRDCSGDIFLHERPKLTNDCIMLPSAELEAFCRHYLSALESESE